MKPAPRSIVLSLIALVGAASLSAQVAERPAAHRASPHAVYMNTKGGTNGLPAASYTAQGNGSNTILVDPEHDLVVVWRGHAGGDFFARVVTSIKS